MGKRKVPAPAPAATVVEPPSTTAFTPAEAKKLAKLLKAADRGKRLGAIRVVSENHEYIATGGCLLPLLESVVAKKKMEDIVKAAGRVIVDYLVGRHGSDATAESTTTLKAMEEATKKPSKYKLAEVMGNLVLNPDRENSWNAVRSLRSMAATVASLPKDNLQGQSLSALLVGSGQPAECLCSLFIKNEKLRQNEEVAFSDGTAAAGTEGVDGGVSWLVMRIQVVDILRVMCSVSNDAIQTVVASGVVPLLLEVLRWITASEARDMPLLTSILVVLFAVAKAGSGAAAGSKTGSETPSRATGVRKPSPELVALAEGGAWGAVHDALKGPIMARAAELQSGASATGGKKAEAAALPPDLAACLDNMARCAEILRVMAMTGAGVEEEGALEAGVAAMSSILGMQGLPREEAAVANLMTGMVKAMGSIACLSESNRVKVCSAGAAPMVLALMAPPKPSVPGTSTAGATLPPADTPHGRLMRKTAEKCLHHLLVSRVTWMADHRALCDTTGSLPGEIEANPVGTGKDGGKVVYSIGAGRRTSWGGEVKPGPVAGPAYLTVDSVLAAANAESIDVRCRAIRLVSRLVSSRFNAKALGAGAVPSLGRLVAWWLRTKDDPEADRTPRSVDAVSPEKHRAGAGGGGGKKGAAPPTEKNEFAAPDEALEAARAAAKRLEDSDGTRVLRNEALAYALGVLLQLAETGRDERLAIGADPLVDLLAKVLKSMPCTQEEFYANVANKNTATGEKSLYSATKTPQVVDGLDRAAALSHANANGRPEPQPEVHTRATGKPDISLDLMAAGCERIMTERHHFCWRGGKGRDPEVELFSPLDWGWDFEVNPSHEPAQPGLILRASVLRLLTTVVAAFDPSKEGPLESPVASIAVGKGAAAAATAATRSTDPCQAASGSEGARSVLRHTLTVCLDLLLVDVRHDTVTVDIQNLGGGRGNGGNDGCSEGAAGNAIDTTAAVTADSLSGKPVSPPEELVHEDIRLGCLRLVASLLRLGRVAREGFVSAADTHRNGWNSLLEKLAGYRSERQQPEDAGGVGTGSSGSAQRESAVKLWTVPDKFACWDFRAGGKWESLRSSLPYVRVVSALLPPLRNPEAPTTHVMAALVGLRQLCKEEEYEVGGTQPEPAPKGEPPLPISREGTAGVLVDTLAGVAVGLGALVPLVSIWGCAAAAAVDGTLPVETTGMVDECQELINYLIRRGHTRETFWASLPCLQRPDNEAAGGAAGATSKSKSPNKAAKLSTKRGKRTSNKHDQDSGAVTTAQNEAGSEPTPLPKLGRPDPNFGPDRAAWGQLLDARVDERRTQTSGTTALLMATATGLQTAVQNLLVAGANSNVRGSDGRTPLMCALAQGMDEDVRELVKSGADVDAVHLHGSNVLKSAFLCPSRRTMRNIMNRTSDTRALSATPADAADAAAAAEAAASALGLAEQTSGTSTRWGSTTRTDHSIDSTGTAKPRSRSRSGSVSVCRTRSRSGSVATGRRRSSLGRAVSFSESGGGATAATAALLNERHRLSRTFSLSDVDSARAALRAAGRRESVAPLNTPRGTTIVQGDARMVRYILSCGADPNVSDAAGDFPLHWAVTGTEVTVSIMNQYVRIVSGSKVSDKTVRTDGQMISGTATTGADGYKREGSISNGDPRQPESMPLVVDDLSLLKVLVEAGSALDACNAEGMTALHAAVIVGRADLAGALLDAGASPNVSDAQGCLPLHYACLRATRGYAQLAARLLDLGMGRPLDKGLHRDLRKGRTRREKLLLDVGDIMRRGLQEATTPSSITQHRATRAELLNYVSTEGLAPLHYVCDGRMAGGGREAAAELLAQAKRRLPPAQPAVSKGDLWPYVTAVASTEPSWSSDRVNALRLLLSEPEVDLKLRAPQGATLLHLAAQMTPKQSSEGAELTLMLVRTGINLDVLDTPKTIDVDPFAGRRRSRSASYRCAFPGPHDGKRSSNASIDHSDLVGTLRHASEGCTSGNKEFKFSALHYALRAESWETVDVLLCAGASVRPDGAFPPCLHVACHAGAPASIVSTLLERGGSGPYTDDHRSAQTWGDLGPESTSGAAFPYATTPLFLAAASGSAELVALLMSRYNPVRIVSTGDVCETGDRILSKTDVWSMQHSPADERSPLHAAAVGGHKEAICVLLDAGAGRHWLNAKDNTGRTALDLAVDWSKWEVAALIAAMHDFDVRLAIDGGPACALLSIERANMAIVDEGSGEASALLALRESNTLLMTLLQRLHAALRQDDAMERTAAVSNNEAVSDARIDDTNETGAATTGECRTRRTSRKTGGVGEERVKTQSMPPPLKHVEKINHLHPCFAEGILYSNAKGVFIPGSAERHTQTDKERAALIIQSTARQAKARRDVTEQKRVRAARKRGSIVGKIGG